MVELWNILCFESSKECVAAGKAKTRLCLPNLVGFIPFKKCEQDQALSSHFKCSLALV